MVCFQVPVDKDNKQIRAEVLSFFEPCTFTEMFI